MHSESETHSAFVSRNNPNYEIWFDRLVSQSYNVRWWAAKNGMTFDRRTLQYRHTLLLGRR